MLSFCVFLQASIKWAIHIESDCKNVFSAIFLFRKVKLIVTVDVLVSVFYAYVQSHLLYGIYLFGATIIM